jgi:hypothetical protein
MLHTVAAEAKSSLGRPISAIAAASSPRQSAFARGDLAQTEQEATWSRARACRPVVSVQIGSL